ncbi:family 20 glycosylhydrolase [Parabacteroides sp. PF5-9]|uniref:family 20 glycosylhydrolase n=1 Tax=Parabacteroides sp. PF5-9 TaxID=1742404 RepID=UPI002474A10B|nr:family 20 glycosylhydrolase [Parabacteroides sp. PF5-9]MDH6357577.1 hexosaminidase [Parabacteroides sp. PF5-9]
MKNLIATICAGAVLYFLAACNEQTTEVSSYNEGINIIPTPANLTIQEGAFKLNKKTSYYASTPEARTIADFFAAKMRLSTGFPILVNDEGSGNISLVIDPAVDVNDEGYILNVTKNEVDLKAKTTAGLFYGMQTLMQLFPAEIEFPEVVSGITWSAPAVTIKDEPRFSHRGIMLDVCRHFIPVENIKKHIDVLSLFKINRLHWHLTDDQAWRIEIKKYPKLTEVGGKRIEGEGFEYGGYFTQEEIKEVVQYAAERFITVIPEIELPGHGMAAIAGYPELSCKSEVASPRIIWGVEDIVFCAGKEETFQFLENVFAEVVTLFPSEYVHIGGDECPKTSWAQCPLCQKRIREEGLKAADGHTAEERLQSYFVQRIEKVLTRLGKKMIGWDEILEGGLAPTATVMSWRGENGGIAAASMGHDVIMTPQNDGMYLDRYEGDSKIEPVTIGGFASLEYVYGYNPVPDTLVRMGKTNHILGAQCNAWSEYMYTPELNEYRIYPRIIALSELTWTPLEKKNYADFERRINNAYVRLDGHDINYYIPQPEQPNGSCNFVAFTEKVSLEFKTGRPVVMVYTVDGTDPTSQSAVYNMPIELTTSGILKIRSLLPSGKMSPTRVITVEKQQLAPAKEVAKTTPGLKMDVTYGYFLESSEMDKATDWKSSVLRDLRTITQVEKTDESMRGVKQYGAIASGYVHIPEDGVYYISSENEEVWIDGKLLVNNKGETKRFSRNDSSAALAKGLHEIKVVFLGHIIGGWPSNWNRGDVCLRKADAEQFSPITPEMLVH